MSSQSTTDGFKLYVDEFAFAYLWVCKGYCQPWHLIQEAFYSDYNRDREKFHDKLRWCILDYINYIELSHVVTSKYVFKLSIIMVNLVHHIWWSGVWSYHESIYNESYECEAFRKPNISNILLHLQIFNMYCSLEVKS